MRRIKVMVSIIMLSLSTVTHAGLTESVFVGSSGHVYLTFLGYEAAYTNTLALHSPVRSGNIFINKTSPAGAVYDLGYFPFGTPLVFSIYVHDTSQTYYSGTASNNPDNVAHAFVQFGPDDLADVGFEDLWNGGDRDYNDLRFSVSNIVPNAVPEPTTLVLLLGVVVALVASQFLSLLTTASNFSSVKS